MIPRLQAEEMMRSAHVQRIAGSAAGWVSSQSKKAVDAASREYERIMRGLQAQATGTAGREVDAQGRPILRTAAAIRKWFFDEGGLRI